MKKWWKALRSETLICIWFTLSALSTLTTFFHHDWSGKPRLISAISAIVGFAWANYKVFCKQEAEVEKLRRAIQSQEIRTSQLRVTSYPGSRYILRPVGNGVGGDFNGVHLEFHLMVENSGQRNAVIQEFQVEITELHQTFPDLKPVEGLQTMPGRYGVQGINPNSILSTTGLIKINAEDTTNRGSLIFFLREVSLQVFAANGLRMMMGNQRKFPSLHCRLTLTDTNQSSAFADFELPEV